MYPDKRFGVCFWSVTESDIGNHLRKNDVTSQAQAQKNHLYLATDKVYFAKYNVQRYNIYFYERVILKTSSISAEIALSAR